MLPKEATLTFVQQKMIVALIDAMTVGNVRRDTTD